jgi:hypothetical protein
MFLLKNKHYFTSSCIFLSPGDVSVTAIAAPTAKRRTHTPSCCCPQPHASLSSRSKMPLPPPMLQSLLFGHSNPSSSHRVLLPPLPAAVLSLLLLPAIACLYRPAPLDGSLLCLSLLCCPLPTLLSTTPIIYTFVTGRRTVLFLIAPLPPSKVVPLFAPPNKIRAALKRLPGS